MHSQRIPTMIIFFILWFFIKYYTLRVNSNRLQIRLGYFTEIRNILSWFWSLEKAFFFFRHCGSKEIVSGRFFSTFQHCLLFTVKLMTCTWSQWGPQDVSVIRADYIARIGLKRENWNLCPSFPDRVLWDSLWLYFSY